MKKRKGADDITIIRKDERQAQKRERNRAINERVLSELRAHIQRISSTGGVLFKRKQNVAMNISVEPITSIVRVNSMRDQSDVRLKIPRKNVSLLMTFSIYEKNTSTITKKPFIIQCLIFVQNSSKERNQRKDAIAFDIIKQYAEECGMRAKDKSPFECDNYWIEEARPYLFFIYINGEDEGLDEKNQKRLSAYWNKTNGQTLKERIPAIFKYFEGQSIQKRDFDIFMELVGTLWESRPEWKQI